MTEAWTGEGQIQGFKLYNGHIIPAEYSNETILSRLSQSPKFLDF